MDTKLVCTARLRFESKHISGFAALSNNKFRYRSLAVAANTKSLWLFGISLYRHINNSVLLRHVAADNGAISFFNPTTCELLLQPAKGFWCFVANDNTRCSAVSYTHLT